MRATFRMVVEKQDRNVLNKQPANQKKEGVCMRSITLKSGLGIRTNKYGSFSLYWLRLEMAGLFRSWWF